VKDNGDFATHEKRMMKLKDRLKHKMVLLFGDRVNSNFTGFYRLPTQFEALAPAIDFITEGRPEETVQIGVFGCSNGSEAYTISSVLIQDHPGLKFRIHASDIDREMIEKAQSGVYSHDEIFNNLIITDEFVENTFEKKGSEYVVREEIARHVDFSVGNILDGRFISSVGPVDLLFAQNFLLHLKRNDAVSGLNNLWSILKHKAVLYLDGTDLDIRTRFTRRHNLKPLEFGIEDIHNEARRARSVGWPYSYWGLEPFDKSQRGWKRRYATIFLKS
jgi:chemotaxis methyl-accepting protein methylase